MGRVGFPPVAAPNGTLREHPKPFEQRTCQRRFAQKTNVLAAQRKILARCLVDQPSDSRQGISASLGWPTCLSFSISRETMTRGSGRYAAAEADLEAGLGEADLTEGGHGRELRPGRPAAWPPRLASPKYRKQPHAQSLSRPPGGRRPARGRDNNLARRDWARILVKRLVWLGALRLRPIALCSCKIVA